MTPRFYSVRWLPFDAWAVTLPPFGVFILRCKRHDYELIRHELGHWQQYKDWGFFRFYWTVLFQYAKYGRFRAPIEADATRRGNAGGDMHR